MFYEAYLILQTYSLLRSISNGDKILHTSQLQRHSNIPFAEFFEWWSDNSFPADDAVPANPHVGQVSSDDTLRHDDGLCGNQHKNIE